MTLVRTVRKTGNSLVVTIPRKDAEELGIHEGQVVEVDIRPMELRPALRPEIREAYEASWKRNEAGYRYLADK